MVTPYPDPHPPTRLASIVPTRWLSRSRARSATTPTICPSKNTFSGWRRCCGGCARTGSCNELNHSFIHHSSTDGPDALGARDLTHAAPNLRAHRLMRPGGEGGEEIEQPKQDETVLRAERLEREKGARNRE